MPLYASLFSMHLHICIYIKGQMDAFATLAGQGANKKIDSAQEEDPSGFILIESASVWHLSGKQEDRDISPESILFEFSSKGVGA